MIGIGLIAIPIACDSDCPNAVQVTSATHDGDDRGCEHRKTVAPSRRSLPAHRDHQGTRVHASVLPLLELSDHTIAEKMRTNTIEAKRSQPTKVIPSMSEHAHRRTRKRPLTTASAFPSPGGRP